MCGIAGYVGTGDRGVLERMTDALRHRGPDDGGFWIEKNVGLGHRRLSILDLSPAGHQPMHSADNTITIVFNGEVYNFRALQDVLKRKGYSFRSGSDTEVIIALYQEYGIECFSYMNGMFALALYDGVAQQLVLARDRLGKKPLYWSLQRDTMVFGSELKALLCHPAIKRTLDYGSVSKYLAYDYVPTPQTLFQDVYKLEPGHALVYENGEVKKMSFWDIQFGSDEPKASVEMSMQSVLKQLDTHLDRAVASRLVADVPVGIFLSGGLDSSIVAYYAQKNSGQKIKTFSIGFSEKSFDESAYARTVAQHLKTDHYEKKVTARDIIDIVPSIGTLFDDPIADYSCIPTYLLSAFSREHVTVALGGDGGDELFFGYPTFQLERYARVLDHMPALVHAAEKMVKHFIAASHDHYNSRFKLDRFVAGFRVPSRYRHQGWMGTFNREDQRSLLTPSIQERSNNRWLYEDIDRYDQRMHVKNPYDRLVYLYLRTYLMDQVLVKVDRASMAASLEVRAPLLDYELVDFVNRIPLSLRRPCSPKYLLKEVAKDVLPRDIVYRKKQGFGVPLSQWLAGELRPLMTDLLSKERMEQGGVFDATAVDRLMRDHLNKKHDNRKQLWSLMVFELWRTAWL